jgi:hypothetical protein
VKKNMNRTEICLAISMLLMALPAPAAAYVDPGSGTMLWQLAAAALFGGLFQIKRVVAWFRGRMTPAVSAGQKSDTADQDKVS